jgi:hypothetical protein
LPVLFDLVPQELRSKPHWLLWRYELRQTRSEAKWTKPPFTPAGAYANSRDPATWSSFTAVKAAYEWGGWDGVGFVHRPEDGLTGVDWDNVRDPATGAIAPEVCQEVKRLDTYTEISPSGTGLRAYAHGTKPGGAAKRDGFEMYDGRTQNGQAGGRYLTLTGHRLSAAPELIHDRQEIISELYHAHFDPPPPRAVKSVLTDDQVLTKLRQAGNWRRVRLLWEGGHGLNDSDADFKLCCVLAGYTRDPAQIDRLVRRSSLFRPKWDLPRGDSTYGAMTIANALTKAAVTYQPSGPTQSLPVGLAVDLAEHIQAQPVEWLWEDRIPRGMITLLDGDPGQGKSLITINIAAAVSTGRPIREGEPALPRGHVLILADEDDYARTVKPRLEAAGADLSRCGLIQGLRVEVDGQEETRPILLPDALAKIEEEIEARGARLLIIDPFLGYLNAHVDSHKDQSIREVLHRLKRIAERTGVAIVLVRHLNKKAGEAAIYRGGGSIAMLAAARSVMLAGRQPDHPDEFALAMVKCNLAAMGETLSY